MIQHYFNFVCWCLRSFAQWLVSYPNHLFAFYKQALREETVMTLVFSVLGWMALMVGTATIVSANVSKNPVLLWIFGFTVFFPPSFFVATLIGMLYDRYCAELQGTADRLKSKQ